MGLAFIQNTNLNLKVIVKCMIYDWNSNKTNHKQISQTQTHTRTHAHTAKICKHPVHKWQSQSHYSTLEKVYHWAESHKYKSNTYQTYVHTANTRSFCKQIHPFSVCVAVRTLAHFKETNTDTATHSNQASNASWLKILNKICFWFLMWCDVTLFGQMVTERRIHRAQWPNNGR